MYIPLILLEHSTFEHGGGSGGCWWLNKFPILIGVSVLDLLHLIGVSVLDLSHWIGVSANKISIYYIDLNVKIISK